MADNLMRKSYTLTGLTLEDAVTELQKVLPREAYKPVPGSAAGLTDIDPAYLQEVATNVFGACGVGWFYDYDTITIDREERKSVKEGRERLRTVYVADLNKLYLYFKYTEGEGVMTSEAILSTGGSENDVKSYAVRGALTNAIGAAFAKLCWQLDVYKGKVSHSNAGSRAPATAQQSKPPATKEATGKPKTNGSGIPEDPAKHLEWAKAVLVPEGSGVPLAGTPLGQAYEDPQFGVAIVKYLTGHHKNLAGDIFSPTSDKEKEAQKAARIMEQILDIK